MNLLAADNQRGASQPYIAGYPSIDSTLAREQGSSSGVLIVHDYSKARGSGVVCENSAPDIGVVLSTGMSGKNCAVGCIGAAAYYRLPPQAGTPVYVAVVAGDWVIKNPGIIPWLERQVALALYKAAQISRFDLAANIPQCADAVKKRVFLMGNVGNFIFLIGRNGSLPFLLRGISK